MALQIYNGLKKKKEIFEPIVPGKVGMYVCGPTVYDSSHVGHARSSIVFDVIVRYLRATGLDVTYVRNFTDIDDKIINRAQKDGVTSKKIAETYIAEFRSDMESLGVATPTVEPKATEHIGQIIKVIRTLEEKGIAYQVEGDVYFSVNLFEGYGKLSGRKLEDMEAGGRVEVDKRKKNPFDFVLWKTAKPGEPSWGSPWGKGRPGWHIECSAMSSEFLGETFDIHGGGVDLVFPHHENEIAQSEAAHGKAFANYWIHNGFVNIDSEKMSKSLGNHLLIKDIVKKYHPDAIRLFLLSSHYRSPVDFTDKALDEAAGSADKIYSLFERAEKEAGISTANLTAETDSASGEIWTRYAEAMDDDFNTARGIGVLFETVKNINRLLDDGVAGGLTDDDVSAITQGLSDIVRIAKTLGIMNTTHQEYFEKKKAKNLQEKSIDPEVIEGLINERTQARKDKDWALADEIRNRLLEMNVVLEDKPDGTTWSFA